MQNTKTPSTVGYMLRHLFTTNITDPLSADSRGYTDYSQYFSGTGAAGQINYLERKPTTSGRCIVQVGGVTKTDGVDYTLDRTTLTITWTGTTPASGTDNIYVDYQATRPWVYDDHPNLNSTDFPRMTVMELGNDNEPPGQGVYQSYASGIGELISKNVKVIVRHKRNNNTYTYASVHLKNYDLVQAISEQVEAYVNANRLSPPWKFWDWEIVRSERITSEEEYYGVLRRDLTVRVRYYRGDT